ncbi:DUF885 domain-containing protein [Marinicauda salina]|uniref:DUF885 domain-containing protein n=1 Tax=Marinicauda salina TaxID=2135793 RepID=A0A2U2BU45_9PROT|nr:DUF885 domain-containing protein [Marinicauda salina]PWE17541.1 DUF885 domain-containing protein [Marinicauda salina]
MRIQLLFGAASLALLAACGETENAAPTAADTSASANTQTAQQTEQTESERLYAWLDEVFQTELAHSPEFKTQLGVIDDSYGQWDPRGDEAARENFERRQGYLDHMRETFDYDALDENAQLTYGFMEHQGEMAARLYEVRESGYVFSPMLDSISGLTSFLINNHRVSEPAHAEAYISRLEGVGAVIDTLVAEAEERAENGVRLPLFAYPRLISAANNQLSGAPFDESDEDSALLDDFRGKVEALEISDEDKAGLIDRARAALVDVYQPAMERYIASLEAMEEDADTRAGIWKNPNGEAYYAAQIANYTTRDDLTAEEIHEIGLSEVERIQNEMRAIMAEVGFEGDLADFFEYMRTSEDFRYPDTEEGRQAYLEESTRLIDQVMERAPEYFDTLPEADLEVRAVEAWREDTATGAFYNQPALDGSRPGYYYVNLSNMDDNPSYLMESLAYHEGAPGHHFQIALAQELEDLPMLQKLGFNSAYVEGWALYAEHLGKDMGFFTDPYRDFGRLSYEIFRAVRLVVDTGIHDQRWTREEAIDYMLANTPMTEGDITPEIERYIVWPGQALSYKIGMMTILDLRERAMDELGEDFTYGGFHDAVLTAGSLPLPLLEERVDAWIAEVGAQD